MAKTRHPMNPVLTDLHREVLTALRGRSLPVDVLSREMAVSIRLGQALLDDLRDWGLTTAVRQRKAK